MRPRRVLVTGSNSFTGSHLVAHLLAQTDCDVLGISRSPEADRVFLPYRYDGEPAKRFRFHQIDLNRSFDDFRRVCDDFAPEGVVHFAAQGEVRSSWSAPTDWYETNCMTVVRLGEFLRKRDYLHRFVAISTPEVYGATGEQIPENHCYLPSTPYAASKLAGELHLHALAKRYGFPVVFTRAANVYGMHQQLYRIIPRAIIYLKQGKLLQLHGRGQAERAFIHVRDVVDLTYRAMTDGTVGEVYHVGPEDGVRSIAQVVRGVCRMMNRSFEEAVELVDENFGQDAVFSMSSAKAISELGWRQRIAFEDGVAQTVRWIENNWKHIVALPHEYQHRK